MGAQRSRPLAVADYTASGFFLPRRTGRLGARSAGHLALPIPRPQPEPGAPVRPNGPPEEERMSWKLSRFRAGELVEVRSREEILAGLDAKGCLDGMPFMPEMLAFCGRRFRVRAVAHKTCDTAKQTSTGRRLDTTVHLDGTSCDGSAHEGCQAGCTLFWKDAWLRSVDDARTDPVRPAGASAGMCTAAALERNTRREEAGSPRYACQATQLYDFTEPLAPWDVRQYLYDVRTGNRSASRVLRVVVLAWVRWILSHTPVGYRMLDTLYDKIHRLLTGHASPRLTAHIQDGQRTPTGRLHLRQGESVRIKSQQEIERTLDQNSKNRGLSFDWLEMAPYCGRVVEVRRSVTKIIEEPTGRMIEMKQPCIMLEGVVCNAEYSACRLNCPRAIPSYWREIWLERIEASPETPADAGPGASGPSPASSES
jgi:hypothetical protein